MNDKERAKMQVAEQCAETREEDLGYQMVRHYNYLSSLNHEWSNLCELAVKMYLPNKKYIDKLEQQLKEAENIVEFIFLNFENGQHADLAKNYFDKYKGDS